MKEVNWNPTNEQPHSYVSYFTRLIVKLTCFLRGVGDGQFLSLNVMGGKCCICGKRMCEGSYGLAAAAAAAAAAAWKNILVVGDMRPADPSRWCGGGNPSAWWEGGCDLLRGLCGESAVRCLWWWWWWWWPLPGELCPFISSWPVVVLDFPPPGLWPLLECWWWWWWWPLMPWWWDDGRGGCCCCCCDGGGWTSVGVADDEVGESTNNGMRSVWASPRICNRTIVKAVSGSDLWLIAHP